MLAIVSAETESHFKSHMMFRAFERNRGSGQKKQKQKTKTKQKQKQTNKKHSSDSLGKLC